MTDSDKISLQEELEDKIDVFSGEFERTLQLDDFIWVENMKPKKMEVQDDEKQPEIITTSIVTVLPYKMLRESSGGTAHSQIEYSNVKKTDGEAVVTSDLDKDLLVEQKYWEQHGSAAKNMNNKKSKYPTSQRLTVTEEKIIDKAKITARHPSSYQFDGVTTAILEKLLKEKRVERLQNVAGMGLNSVVIHSPNDPNLWILPYGLAVKVYKLSNDVKKNNTVLKRAQREFDHLEILEGSVGGFAPRVLHKCKNVTVMTFIGDDQETAPSINSLPLEQSVMMYDMIVTQMQIWYKKQIVHGKLCSKYIRIWWDRPYFFGWSHSVRTDHPKALKKLMRDCYFVTKFFECRGVQKKSTEELFKDITCLDEISKDVLDIIYNYGNLWPDQHQTNPNRRKDIWRPIRSRFK